MEAPDKANLSERTIDSCPVSVGLIQMAMTDDFAKNREKAALLIRRAATQGAQIICLPELFTTLYFANEERASRDWTEEVPGETGAMLSSLARELGTVIVGGSVYERGEGGKNFNTSLVYDADGRLLGKYRKMHIPHDPSFFEQHYFERGDLGYRVFDTRFGRVAVLICYDQWFPEAARAAALAGAQIIYYPTAIGTVQGIEQREGNWQEAWENVQRGHAIANNVVVCAVNRVGTEGESRFWGGSFACDAFGRTLARAGNEEEVVVTTVDFGHSEFVREGWRFFYNRRPETYGKLQEME